MRVLGHDDKRQCTVVTGTCADGTTMPLGVIFAGQSNSRRAIPKCQRWPNNWWSFQTKSHWMTEAALRSYYLKVCRIFLVSFFLFFVVHVTVCQVVRLFVKRRREELGLAANAVALMIVDTYSTHLLPFFRNWANGDNILVLFVPPGFTDTLQAQDLAINGPFKGCLFGCAPTLSQTETAGKGVRVGWRPLPGEVSRSCAEWHSCSL